MSTLAYTLTDSVTMLRRNLRRLQRYPSMTLLLVGMPIVFLLLFVYVFGGQLGAGFTGDSGRDAYLDYVMPAILLITVAAAAQGTAITVAMDMTSGIIDRFRTMAIARSSVLTGHVIASVRHCSASPSFSPSRSHSASGRPRARWHGWQSSACSPCSPSRWSGCARRSAWPPRP